MRRLNGAISQLGYDGYFGTPYEYSAISREAKLAELTAMGLGRFQARGTSGDANLWCREFESGTLDNPESFWAPESLFEWTATCDLSRYSRNLTVQFSCGSPVAINGVPCELIEIITMLNSLVGAFGIGRFSGLEHLEQGEKVLEVREAPAAMILMDSFRHLETATLDSELLREKIGMEQIWVREALEGRWFGRLRAAANSFISDAAQHVSGTVSYYLRQGSADLCGIQAEHPLYLTDRDNWEKQVSTARSSRALALIS